MKRLNKCNSLWKLIETNLIFTRCLSHKVLLTVHWWDDVYPISAVFSRLSLHRYRLLIYNPCQEELIRSHCWLTGLITFRTHWLRLWSLVLYQSVRLVPAGSLCILRQKQAGILQSRSLSVWTPRLRTSDTLTLFSPPFLYGLMLL